LDAETSSIQHKVSGDTSYFLFNNEVVAMKVENMGSKKYSLFKKYIKIFKNKYLFANESIFYNENGDIIEDSSVFYHCTRIGNDLLISYCFNNKIDSSEIKLDGDFDPNFVSYKKPHLVKFKGNHFLVRNLEELSLNDTFRAIIQPRYATVIENGEVFHNHGMIFIEYPNQFDFSELE
jgi:hypothetical protein